MRKLNWNVFFLMVVSFLFMLNLMHAAKAQVNRGYNPGHSEFHEWYKTLKMKERGYQHISCCSDYDCQPVKFLGWDAKGNPRIRSRFGEHTVPFEKIQQQPSPDQGWHWCGVQNGGAYGDDELFLMNYCLIAPEMAG